jgi:hypothetical protein
VPFPRFSSSINWRKQRKKYKKNQKRRFHKLAEAISIFRRSTWASFARAMLLTASFSLASQNSLAILALIAWTSSLGRRLQVLRASRNCGSFSQNFTRSTQSKSWEASKGFQQKRLQQNH